MIRLVSIIIVGLFLWMEIVAAGQVDPTIRQRLEQVHRVAQQMVEHGRHGHPAEIVKYANEMIRQMAPLLVVVGEAHKPAVGLRKQRAMLQTAMKSAMEHAAAAARLGEARNSREAMAAARRAAFQIKHARAQWEATQ